jgi:hypothetical protein
VAAVNAEIPIRREEDGILERFGHANEASIGEAHGNIAILCNQLQNWVKIFHKAERDCESTAAEQSSEIRSAALAKKMESLRKNRFASQPRRRVFRGLSHCPLVMGVAPA